MSLKKHMEMKIEIWTENKVKALNRVKEYEYKRSRAKQLRNKWSRMGKRAITRLAEDEILFADDRVRAFKMDVRVADAQLRNYRWNLQKCIIRENRLKNGLPLKPW
jgi:hypothetical protein